VSRVEILATDNPHVVLERAEGLLTRDPVANNVMLTLLHARVAEPLPGRYWVVNPAECAGVVFQSPTVFPALVSPMRAESVDAAVETIAAAAIELPGVNGDAATAARFAGAWTEATKSAATPVRGQRIHEVREVTRPRPAGGGFRRAETSETDLIVEWTRAFHDEIGEVGDLPAAAARRVVLGQFWLWDDGGPVSMAALSEPTAGVVRVQAVYTPENRRGHGYASGCVATLSARALEDNLRCILYTDVANATSNAIYRSIGYRAVSEGLRYRFD
jgi:predicted GNAT family acetyltransferase